VALVTAGAFFDTSVLLGGLIDLGSSSKAAQSLFDRVAAGRISKPRTAWHCCLEFYAVATRLPEEFRLRPRDAATLLEAEVLERFVVFDLPAQGRRAFIASCAREQTRGGRLYDAHIAEIARNSSARLVVTENTRDFAGLERQGIAVRTAAEVVREITTR
jgi:predicted nucleic acid-binding protein